MATTMSNSGKARSSTRNQKNTAFWQFDDEETNLFMQSSSHGVATEKKQGESSDNKPSTGSTTSSGASDSCIASWSFSPSTAPPSLLSHRSTSRAPPLRMPKEPIVADTEEGCDSSLIKSNSCATRSLPLPLLRELSSGSRFRNNEDFKTPCPPRLSASCPRDATSITSELCSGFVSRQKAEGATIQTPGRGIKEASVTTKPSDDSCALESTSFAKTTTATNLTATANDDDGIDYHIQAHLKQLERLFQLRDEQRQMKHYQQFALGQDPISGTDSGVTMATKTTTATPEENDVTAFTPQPTSADDCGVVAAAVARTEIELCPGYVMPLRGVDETLEYLGRCDPNLVTSTFCHACNHSVHILVDAALGLCPTCHLVLPREDTDIHNQAGYGVSLGFLPGDRDELQAVANSLLIQ